jgi:hypothetical protein
LAHLGQLWEIVLVEEFPQVAANLVEKRVLPGLYTAPWFLKGFMNVAVAAADFRSIRRIRVQKLRVVRDGDGRNE